MRPKPRIDARLALLEAKRDKVTEKLFTQFDARGRVVLTPDQQQRVIEAGTGDLVWPEDAWRALMGDSAARAIYRRADWLDRYKRWYEHTDK